MDIKNIRNDDSLLAVQEANEKVRHQFYWLAEEVERLEKENAEWKQKFHDRCDVQLDEFRKHGMTEASEKCVKICSYAAQHWWTKKGHVVAESIEAAIRKEFNLPKAG